jgi:ubiquinol-cytochrome c reductase cytochrome b subunit
MRWLDDRLPLPRLVYDSVGRRLSGAAQPQLCWNFGVLAGLALACQISTGIVLAMHYRGLRPTRGRSIRSSISCAT